MSRLRQGIWKCPDCSKHQTWKTKRDGVNKLDRKCIGCGKRARFTIERSSSGQGRSRSVEIWERSILYDFDDLEHEVNLRDDMDGQGDNLAFQPELSTEIGENQSDLPPIRGVFWDPERALEFQKLVDSEEIKRRFMTFVAERHDGYLGVVADCWIKAEFPDKLNGEAFHEYTKILLDEIFNNLSNRTLEPKLSELRDIEIIPMRLGTSFLSRRLARLITDLKLCLRRIGYLYTITTQHRIDWQRWMIRTRLLDEELKSIFSEGLKTHDGQDFGGKGFRSTWQEAIVACASPLTKAINLPEDQFDKADIVAPMIRDVGLALAMGQTPLEIMLAQVGKAESYMDGGNPNSGGRDLHIGNWEKGILPPTAPLPIASATTTGIALSAKKMNIPRFHFAPVGEGCSSSGEFWEAINFAGVRGLPICYMIQNNQIALDTFASKQSGAETFGDKGYAVGIPSWTIDGSDPDQFFASISVAREFATMGGGPTLIHVETMRGCGHAHHHDDLYLGSISGNPPGYVDRKLIEYWANKDPLSNHAEKMIHLGIDEKILSNIQSEEEQLVKKCRKELEEISWPEGNSVKIGITSISDAFSHSEQFSRIENTSEIVKSPLNIGEMGIEFSNVANSWTYSRSIQNAMVKIAEIFGDKSIFMGEDMEIAGAFGMNLPLRAKGHQEKLLDMPLSESIIIHSATGAALGGMRPIAEIQFGGFAALAMNPLINNAAQLRWRWGAEVPMTIRIPLGAKTRSGPYHANMIESWFANDPGLVIVFPSNPQDAYDLLIESHNLPDPVIYLEHIGLYGLRGGMTGWGDNINQLVKPNDVMERIENNESTIGKGKLIRGGRDITIVTWGAMVHVAIKTAKIASERGIEVEIIDLRTLLPFDSKICVESVNRTGKLLVLQEAQWTGGFGHTISSRIIEESFWNLEYPPVVIGALDTPVPFSPTLEDFTIPSADIVLRHIERACSEKN